LQAIEDIIATGCTRILTSGGYDKAIEGRDAIAQAVAIANGRIQIMAGSGVSPDNALQLAGTGVDALHFSAKQMIQGGMKYRNPRISMGGTDAVDEYALRTINEEEIRAIVKLIKKQL
jgi:copper homeostasis protein